MLKKGSLRAALKGSPQIDEVARYFIAIALSR
jgi:hypothetical protein